MYEEKQNRFLIVGLIIVVLLIAIFEISQLGNDTTNVPQRNPVSQTRAQDEYPSFNLTMENEGTELRGVINNKTEIQVWSANETEIIYRGTLENYSGAQFVIRVNKSWVDTVQIGGRQQP